MAKEKQESLFDAFGGVEEEWKKEWNGMPEFKADDLTSYQYIIVHFQNKEDVAKFAKLVDQKLTYKTKSIWYPPAEIANNTVFRYVEEQEKDNQDED